MKLLSFGTAIVCLGISQQSVLAQDAWSSLMEPYEHVHFSELGTPIIHSFGIEPAFTGRDLFLSHTYTKGKGFTEHESELEMEWGVTKGFGFIVEVPYVYEDEEGVGTEKGFGDLVIVPRVLLVSQDRFLLTGQVEIGLPTGSEAFGNETAIAPGIATWHDLGNWFTLNTNIAVEHNFDGDETELEFGFGLVKSFGEKPELDDCHDHHGHNHTASGLLNLHLEVTGGTPLNGDDQGDFEVEGLVGVSYGVTDEMDVRFGYSFPISTPRDFDHRLTAGVIVHF
jgi:hypothetical protein